MTNLVKELIKLVTKEEPPPAHLNIGQLMALAKANNLLLAAGDALHSSLEIPPPFQERLQQSKALEANTVPLLAPFLAHATQKGMAVLTIKSFLPFPYADSNIDLVAVEPTGMEIGRALLADLGFVRHRNLADLREPKKEMYYHRQHGRHNRTFPKLHLHGSISWNGVIYLEPRQVWERHQTTLVDGLTIPIPSPEDELLIMAAHAMFENKYITLHELIYLRWLTSQALDWDYITDTAQARFWLDALLFFLASAANLAQTVDLPITVNIKLPPTQLALPVSLPYMLPLRHTTSMALRKLWLDVTHGRLRELPRQLITYSVVDCLWMYRKARRKTAIAKI
jgi:hypothetical protein